MCFPPLGLEFEATILSKATRSATQRKGPSPPAGLIFGCTLSSENPPQRRRHAFRSNTPRTDDAAARISRSLSLHCRQLRHSGGAFLFCSQPVGNGASVLRL